MVEHLRLVELGRVEKAAPSLRYSCAIFRIIGGYQVTGAGARTLGSDCGDSLPVLLFGGPVFVGVGIEVFGALDQGLLIGITQIEGFPKFTLFSILGFQLELVLVLDLRLMKGIGLNLTQTTETKLDQFVRTIICFCLHHRMFCF